MPCIDDDSLNALVSKFNTGSVNDRHFALLADMVKMKGYRHPNRSAFYVNYSVTGTGQVGTYRQALVSNYRRTSLMVSASVNVAPPNFATWDPATLGIHGQLTNGNLTFQAFANANPASVRTTISKSSGKWYVELSVGTDGTIQIGVGNSSLDPNVDLRSQGGSWVYAGAGSGNQFWHNGVILSFYGTGYTSGDIVNFKIDMDAGNLEYGKNGVYYGSLVLGLVGNMFITVGAQTGGNAGPVTLNAGATPFVYPVPAGYNAGFFAGPANVTVPKILFGTAPVTETAYSANELNRAIPLQAYEGSAGIYQFFIPRNAPVNPISFLDLASSAGVPTSFTILEGYSA